MPATAILEQVRDMALAHRHQVAAVVAENDRRVAVSTELLLESQALLARVNRLLDECSVPRATPPHGSLAPVGAPVGKSRTLPSFIRQRAAKRSCVMFQVVQQVQQFPAFGQPVTTALHQTACRPSIGLGGGYRCRCGRIRHCFDVEVEGGAPADMVPCRVASACMYPFTIAQGPFPCPRDIDGIYCYLVISNT
jgi:hypothetical protein